MKITFDNIYNAGQVTRDTDLYEHVFYQEMLIMYDSNFIKFKRMPTLAEFKEAEHYLRAFHQENGQKHLKFYFPQDEQLSKELNDYLDDACYAVGFQELYEIKPSNFPAVADDPKIDIQTVSTENLEAFLKLQYVIDLEFGSNFAEQKQKIHRKKLTDSRYLQVIAYYDGILAGSVDVIIAEETAEIDSFTVLDSYQRKGIGSRMQKYVMDQFMDKTIILVADGEDTPREMYRKQNYQYLGFKYEVQKVFADLLLKG